jgi:Flp pilus assembly protein TadD
MTRGGLIPYPAFGSNLAGDTVMHIQTLTQTLCLKVCPKFLPSAFLFFALLTSLTEKAAAQPSNTPSENEIRLIEQQGTVEVISAGGTTWMLTETNQLLRPFDRLRTGPNSRVALLWSDESVIPFGALTELEILPPHEAEAQSGLHLVRGILSFFHRDKPGRIRIITRGAVAGVEGTEFILAVNDSDRTTLSVVDGKVRFGNEHAALVLTNGQQATLELGQAPVRTAGFVVNNLLQWGFYYPAVIDPAELPLTADEQKILGDSLAAYRAGDLLAALAKYPSDRQPASGAERVYFSALLLSVGEIENANHTLAAVPTSDANDRPQRLASALRELISAVKRQTNSAISRPQLASELLAHSYYEQSRAERGISLVTTLALAKQAVANSPEFGFGWTRVAELEFSFGHTREALFALEKSLSLTPRNAQALALKGFLLAAQNKTHEAISWFNRSLEVDAALGNAWLGRGLCRIHQGDANGGREDLLIAAALEPQRAELRSYLGKAYANENDFSHATKELQLSRKLDPQDPTPWLYSALLNQENNQVNEAIRDLEKSKELNDNRSVYRSQLLLDQDQAVRSANLAAIYRDAGLLDVSVREASRAVTYDYANYSAHLFLANSYEAMRDRNNYNLRFETPAITEYLVANLLAPVDAGPLSPAISQNEYSRFFQQNRLGLISSTEYLSRGAWSQSVAQYGTYDTFNYSLEGVYRTDPGQRRNNDFELHQISLSLKQQLTAQDSLYFNVGVSKITAGDVSQVYDPAFGSRSVRTEETHEPDLALGYHHEWSPGVHTMILLGRQVDIFSVNNPDSGGVVVLGSGEPISRDAMTGLQIFPASEQLKLSQELYSAELQQIFQQAAHSTIIGMLFQHTDFNNKNLERSDDGRVFDPSTTNLIALQNINTDFERFSVYGYHSWQVLDSLLLAGGLSYDRIFFPKNFRSTPFSDLQETKDQISPKAGLIWTPATNTTVRAAYTRSLAGASIDQSFRLEPTQVAGINQSYRSLISESLGGANAGATFDTFGLGLEQKFKTGTYIGLAGELLYSQVRRQHGIFYFDIDTDDYASPSNVGLKERLDYRERSIVFTVDQLIEQEWSVGMRYRLTQAELGESFPQIPESLQPPSRDPNFPPRQHLESLLHQVNLHANFNHASGIFASFEAIWYLQSNTGFTPNQPGDDFWQFNLLGGYRFCHRRAKVEAGVLNLSDQDYRLNPLVWHNDLPRERTFVARCQFSF